MAARVFQLEDFGELRGLRARVVARMKRDPEFLELAEMLIGLGAQDPGAARRFVDQLIKEAAKPEGA